jgi:uncharacterized cofD-like protein
MKKAFKASRIYSGEWRFDAFIKACYIVPTMKLKETSWLNQIFGWLKKQLKWLGPGLGMKRWMALMVIGTAILGLGLSVLVLDIYRNASEHWFVEVLGWLSLRFLPRWVRFILFSGAGFTCIYCSITGISRTVLEPFVPQGEEVIDAIANFRRRTRGPKIVALGGGSGMFSLLRGLKNHTSNITAVVTMADDGGSSGELRRRIGTPPPGDLRNCLTALSSDEAMLTQIFQYRFGEEYGLNGHSLGNLFITAMGDITGSFEEGVAEAGNVLAITGQVLPATIQDVRLAAKKRHLRTEQTTIVHGESEIPKAEGKIERVWLDPENPQAFPPAIQAILGADLIVVGPGSLYTSILANLLVPDISRALKASKAMKFYISNITSQPGETDGYSVHDHVDAIEDHLGFDLFDLVICNNRTIGIDLPSNLSWVRYDDSEAMDHVVYQADLVQKEWPTRHDSEGLAQIIMDLFYERTGPLLLKDEEMTE